MTVAFGGILVMSVVIGGCGGREDAKKSIKIGISVYDQYDTFVSEMMKDFNDYATKRRRDGCCDQYRHLQCIGKPVDAEQSG